MNRRECKRLVWKYVGMEMDDALASFDVSNMLLGLDADEVDVADLLRLHKSWIDVRLRIADLAANKEPA